MKTQCVIDIKNQLIDVEWGHEADRIVIDFVVAGAKGESHDFKNISFGYQLTQNGELVSEDAWPSSGIRVKRVDSGLINSFDIELEIEQNYDLIVWYFDGNKKYAEVTEFFSGKPPKLYDSMIWNEEEKVWNFPKPYPNDGNGYYWDEQVKDWQIMEEESPCCPEEGLVNEN